MVSVLKIIEQITKLCPGITVESIGETDIIIEKASLQHDKPEQKNGFGAYAKIAVVSLICFFGSAFTIMAFHNDVGLADVLSRIYKLVTGGESSGFTALEISYSIGLAAGIIVFYNHIGGRRLTSDPTPLEVEMRNYERDVRNWRRMWINGLENHIVVDHRHQLGDHGLGGRVYSAFRGRTGAALCGEDGHGAVRAFL